VALAFIWGSELVTGTLVELKKWLEAGNRWEVQEALKCHNYNVFSKKIKEIAGIYEAQDQLQVSLD
jgi:hypothetical protein